MTGPVGFLNPELQSPRDELAQPPRARACRRRSQDELAKAMLDRLIMLASAIAAFEEESLSVRVMVKKGTRTLVF